MNVRELKATGKAGVKDAKNDKLLNNNSRKMKVTPAELKLREEHTIDCSTKIRSGTFANL
jgi:hypothetical protein